MGASHDDLYAQFPDGFFSRADESNDAFFYEPQRLVTHIDQGAIDAVGMLYDELNIAGDVLDLMSSWISHFRDAPDRLTVLGMNADELNANPVATTRIVHDLNLDPRLPFADASFDDAVCAVSVDYLARPLEVFAEVARVLRPGGRFVATFSNRCFPTKVIQGWLRLNDGQRCELVSSYFALTGCFEQPTVSTRRRGPGDPLFAVHASVAATTAGGPGPAT